MEGFETVNVSFEDVILSFISNTKLGFVVYYVGYY